MDEVIHGLCAVLQSRFLQGFDINHCKEEQYKAKVHLKQSHTPCCRLEGIQLADDLQAQQEDPVPGFSF